jgi:phage-related protein
MNHRTPISQCWLVLLALTTIFWAPTPARAQSQTMSPQAGDNDVTHRQLADFDRFLDNHADLASQLRKDPSLINNEEFVENHADLQQYVQQHPEIRQELSQNPNRVMRQENRYDRQEDQARDRDPNSDRDRNRDRDVTRTELANMDRFLDSHPEIAEQLKRDPSLVNNKKFTADHPALQQFLAEHPGVREEYKENPNAFMRQENRFDERQDGRDRDVTRTELANMDRFLDSHPEIAEQLKRDPSLVNNKKFTADHPALQQFLAEHPGVREEYKENPNAFMREENRFDYRQDNRDRDVTRTELANMDRFLDSHPEIAEQLKRDPSLVKNQKFAADHPALQQFLAEHPGVREEYKENPNAFMRQENRFDYRQDSVMHGSHELNRGELSSFNEFLENHNNISGELSKNPTLANNHEYLENHPALRDYLSAHPQVQEGLSKNPQSFLKSAQQVNPGTTTTPATAAVPKSLKAPQNK